MCQTQEAGTPNQVRALRSEREKSMAQADDARISKFLDTIVDRAEQLVNLQIVTAIGQVGWDEARDAPDIKSSKAIYSNVNLLQGDIRTFVDEGFFDDRFASLREFHQKQEQRGHLIIKDNIQALKDLVGLVRDIGKAE